MSRNCCTCQHLKRPEIDRRLAAGEPVTQVARDYDLNRVEPASTSDELSQTWVFQPDQERGCARQCGRRTVAIEREPERRLFELRARIDQIVEQAQQQGSLNVAISGLNSIRQTLDSLARLAGHLQPASTQVNVAVQTNVNVDARAYRRTAHSTIRP